MEKTTTLTFYCPQGGYEITIPAQDGYHTLKLLELEESSYGKVECPDKISQLLRKTIQILNTSNKKKPKRNNSKGSLLLQMAEKEIEKETLQNLQKILMQAKMKNGAFVWC